MQLTRDPFNIIVAGVGGQGNILASEMIATTATEAGYNVVVGETYGASQRGGAVMSHIRLSTRADYGPLIPQGEADIILAFEPLEAWRVAMDYGNPETELFVNLQKNYPITALSGEQPYPDEAKLLADVEKLVGRMRALQATDLARQLGEPKAQNLVMVGVLAGSGLLPLEPQAFEQVIADTFTGDQRELSLLAFRAGVRYDCNG